MSRDCKKYENAKIRKKWITHKNVFYYHKIIPKRKKNQIPFMVIQYLNFPLWVVNYSRLELLTKKAVFSQLAEVGK